MVGAALTVGLLGVPMAAVAQNVDRNDATVLEPVIVTARKTDETLQAVPQSVTVLPGDKLANIPFDPASAIAQGAPNVSLNRQSAGLQYFSIRGVSTLGAPASYADGTVSFNIDGVPQSLMSVSNIMLDIARVEVLHGPQGTLWGSNALGGAINIMPNQPDGVREIRLGGEFGSDSYSMGEAVLGGQIIPDTLNGRLALRFAHQDGTVPSVNTKDLNEHDVAAFRGGLRYVGFENTTITLSADYMQNEGNPPFTLLRGAPGFPISGILSEPELKMSHGGVTLKAEREFSRFTLTSISAYQRNSLKSWTDTGDSLISAATGFPAISSRAHVVDKEDIYSQELRLNSRQGDPIRWVVGASVMRTEGTRACAAVNCAPFPYFNTVTLDTMIDATNFGVFADLSAPFAQRWELSIGGRLSFDDIDINRNNSLGVPGLIGSNSTSQDYPTGRVALSYEWSDDVRAYASVSRGHATRVFPLYDYPVNGVVAEPYPAATGRTYEGGLKANLFDNRLYAEANVFRQ